MSQEVGISDPAGFIRPEVLLVQSAKILK